MATTYNSNSDIRTQEPPVISCGMPIPSGSMRYGSLPGCRSALSSSDGILKQEPRSPQSQIADPNPRPYRLQGRRSSTS